MKIILDLCGGTGSWSKPYKEAGYDVKVITLPYYDVRNIHIFEEHIVFHGNPDFRVLKESIYGILAAPPCTMFSFARTNAKKPRDLKEGMECVRACLEIIWSCQEFNKMPTAKKTLSLKFWALENPYFGFLKNFLGKPVFIFDPWEFGDGYQKRTALWGNFNEPQKTPVKLTSEMKKLTKTNSYLHKIKFDKLLSKEIHPESVLDRQARRAITPAGFAKAFFKTNQ